MISMAVELLAVLLGYKVFGQWSIKSEAEPEIKNYRMVHA